MPEKKKRKKKNIDVELNILVNMVVTHAKRITRLRNLVTLN